MNLRVKAATGTAFALSGAGCIRAENLTTPAAKAAERTSQMEKTKKHIEFHIDIDGKADQLHVNVDAEKPTTGELLVGCLAVANCVAETVARTGSLGKQKVLQNIAAMFSMLADEPLDEEES